MKNFYAYRGVDPRTGRTPAGVASKASVDAMSFMHAIASNDTVPTGPVVSDSQAGASAATEESMFDKLGPWLWIAPAGVVAIALVAYFVKRKSLGGYRRRRRSRR